MSMLTSVLAVVKAAAEQFVPGVKSYEDVADAVIALVGKVRATLSETDQATLDAELPALLDKMNRDVDAAIAALRGE